MHFFYTVDVAYIVYIEGGSPYTHTSYLQLFTYTVEIAGTILHVDTGDDHFRVGH